MRTRRSGGSSLQSCPRGFVREMELICYPKELIRSLWCCLLSPCSPSLPVCPSISISLLVSHSRFCDNASSVVTNARPSLFPYYSTTPLHSNDQQSGRTAVLPLLLAAVLLSSRNGDKIEKDNFDRVAVSSSSYVPSRSFFPT